jgi:hypothetical protein
VDGRDVMVGEIQGHLRHIGLLQPPAHPLYSRQSARFRVAASPFPDVQRNPGSENILQKHTVRAPIRPPTILTFRDYPQVSYVDARTVH